MHLSPALDLTLGACMVGQLAQGIRFLRVAQREHYLAGSVTRFAGRWWRCSVLNSGLFAFGVAGAVAGLYVEPTALATASVCVVGPSGLGLRGRSSKLAWTRRLRVLATVATVLVAGADAVGIVAGGAFGTLTRTWIALGCSGTVVPGPLPQDHRGVSVIVVASVAIAVPILVDLALVLTAPFEKLAARRFVKAASAKLAEIGPKVVAVTGSYGKTSTKNYIQHLLAGSFSVVASPASFNNMAGLARAVNENLTPGTRVFVAEMGTYGPGEIAKMCRWLIPEVAIITAIGPVHLERMKSEEKILRAKAEIFARASVAIVNADDPRLASLADEMEVSGREVLRASVGSLPSVSLPDGAAASNIACAVAVARHLGVSDEEIATRIGSLPEVPHRRTTYLSEKGFTVVDDTYNSNPAGCRAALETLVASTGPGGRSVVVSPGMVELGRRQGKENAGFAAAVLAGGAELVVVGRTNRRALLRGARSAGEGAIVEQVATREEAVQWVRSHLGPGDAVLYENDLPDHFP